MNTNEHTKAVIDMATGGKYDPQQGQLIHEHMIKLGLETWNAESYDPAEAARALEDGITNAFSHLGLDPNDPSTIKTPARFACMMVGELTKCLNYDFWPKCTTQPNGNDKGEGSYDQMVRVKDIQILSLCEHHLQTIDGMCHVAYIPSTKVLGLSKTARVAEFFARRPQIQERMTEQIYHALSYILETEDVAVVVDATHYCMRARGVLQGNATTQTNRMGGRFLTNPALREEFLSGI